MLIALAILALSLGTLFQITSNSIAETARAEDTLQATVLAKSIVAQLGTSIPITAGEVAGSSGIGRNWKLQQIELPDVGGGDMFKRYKEVVTVEWGAGKKVSSISLVTLRIGTEKVSP